MKKSVQLFKILSENEEIRKGYAELGLDEKRNNVQLVQPFGEAGVVVQTHVFALALALGIDEMAITVNDLDRVVVTFMCHE